MNLNTIIDMYRQMEWADAMVWNAVLASGSRQTDEKLREYLYHLHIVQHVFFRMWRGEPVETSYPTFEDAKSLMLWARSYYSEALAFLESLSDEKVSEAIPVPWASMVEERIGRSPETPTIGDTILQVALHTTYHRGQINSRLRVRRRLPTLQSRL
jgi:uncharacterized damage-inducible protein DinB